MNLLGYERRSTGAVARETGSRISPPTPLLFGQFPRLSGSCRASCAACGPASGAAYPPYSSPNGAAGDTSSAASAPRRPAGGAADGPFGTTYGAARDPRGARCHLLHSLSAFHHRYPPGAEFCAFCPSMVLRTFPSRGRAVRRFVCFIEESGLDHCADRGRRHAQNQEDQRGGSGDRSSRGTLGIDASGPWRAPAVARMYASR